MHMGDISEVARGFLFVWVSAIFILGLCNLYHSVQVKQKRHIVISSGLLLIEYVMLQMISDSMHGQREGEDSSVIGWILLIAGITIISITLASFFRHWKGEHITPMSVKDSMDMLDAGLCYWEEGGRIILSNKKMDEICLALTGEVLLNGEKFYECIDSECVPMPDGRIQYFSLNEVEFDDKKIQELVASDVTELYKKNEMLELETSSLRKMNDSLRRYNQNIEETVRKQEILDTKVYIHDEMNRLMLITTAMTETTLPEEDFRSVLTLWRNNAVLLGNKTEKKEEADVCEIDKLAKLLGIHVIWEGIPFSDIPEKFRELLVMITREAIANAVKHAEAKAVTIDVEKREEELAITIRNDGQRPMAYKKEGGGLSNIRRLIEAQRGRLEVVAEEQFVLCVTFPISFY